MPRSASLLRLGDYEIQGEIARGGMGVVYRARQAGLERSVALKLMGGGALASDEQVARFRVEARAAANLHHPNIVAIHDIGEQDGQLFFSMALIEGPSLHRRLADGPLPPAEAARLVAKLARAVHYAHQHGVLHRDLKPGNVLLDGAGEPHLTDFGLAKLAEREATLTAADAVMGTPAYMSPEQARGDTRALTTATDVYGLGAVLFECLTGKAPFSGRTAMDTLSAVLTREPPSPSQANAAVDRDLETICLKCLEKEPQRRYASAEALADDLDRYLRHETILARPSTRWTRLRNWARRRPAIAALAAALTAALLAGAVGVAWEWRRAELEAERARDSAEALRQNLYVADLGLAYQGLESGNVVLARDLLERHRPRPGEPDLRGFEWRYLWGETRPREQLTLRAASEIWGAALSPDGRFFAGASEHGGVQVWEVATRREVASIASASDVLYSVAFSPDGHLLAAPAGTEDRRAIRLWRFESGVTETLLEGHADDVFSLVWSPDGRTLASSSGFAYDTEATGELFLWDVAGDRAPTPLTGHSSSIGFIAFSPDGKLLATPHGDGAIHLWDVRARRIAATLRGHRGLVVCVAFSPDGRRLASGGVDGTVRLWNTAALELESLVGAHQGSVFSVDFSPDGKRLASSGIDHTARVWDVENGGELDRLAGHVGRVFTVHFAPDGERLVTGSADGTARFWVASRRETSGTFDRYAGTYATLDFSRDGWLVRTSLSERQVTLWKDLVKVATLPARQAAITSDGRFLIAEPPGNGFEVWELASGAPIRLSTHALETRFVGPVASSPDGSLVALSVPGESIGFWEVGSWRRSHGIDWPAPGPLGGHEFSADGRLYAASFGSNQVGVWRSSDGAPVASLRLPATSVGPVTFSPDGALLATGDDTAVGLWELPSGNRVGELRGDAGLVWSLRWSGDGKTLAVGTQDGAVMLWNTATRRLITALPPHTSIVCDIAFSPNDDLLATISVDHELRLLRAPDWRETDR